MPHKRRVFGDTAERLAETYLLQKGYTILDRQFLTRIGEIDLIAQDRDEIVFVEVKARHSDAFGYPEASVTKTKLRKIGQTGEIYLRTHGLTGRHFRLDVIAVEFQFHPPRVTHYEAVG
jgi:putative endonuclease